MGRGRGRGVKMNESLSSKGQEYQQDKKIAKRGRPPKQQKAQSISNEREKEEKE